MASLESTIRTLFKALDRKDFATILKMTDQNAEVVDEISRKWIRGKTGFRAYIQRVGPELSDITSRLGRIHARILGGLGTATFMVSQSYRLSGKKHNLHLATSMVWVRRAGDWKFTLIHMTPLKGS